METTSAKATTTQALCMCRKWGTRLPQVEMPRAVGKAKKDGAFGCIGPQNLVEDGLEEQDAEGVKHDQPRPAAARRATIAASRAARSAGGGRNASCGSACLRGIQPLPMPRVSTEIHPSIVSGGHGNRLIDQRVEDLSTLDHSLGQKCYSVQLRKRSAASSGVMSRCGMPSISKPTMNLRTVAERSSGG